MKYLKSFNENKQLLKDINDKQEWLKSVIDDIVDCSTELTDLPYNFRHCGNYNENNEENERLQDYLSVVTNTSTLKSKYTINYSGEILDKSVNAYTDYTYENGEIKYNSIELGFVQSIFKIPIEELNDSDDEGAKLLKDLLPASEEVVNKLTNIVFDDYTKVNCFINCYPVSRGTCIVVGINII